MGVNESLVTLEEGVAALATTLCDEDLQAATSGAFGPEIRLLTIAEKVTRSRKTATKSGSAA